MYAPGLPGRSAKKQKKRKSFASPGLSNLSYLLSRGNSSKTPSGHHNADESKKSGLHNEQAAPWLLTPASQMATRATRAEDWDSLAVIHAGRRPVTTWDVVRGTRGKHWLDPACFRGLAGSALRLYRKTVATVIVIFVIKALDW
ncbi:unnamed protein product [Protopolystoma xenopodis]|uniref:Uncharacterized protein n=1 Tax=Protopolystoma xenopodis TaxID=117903 RepID=A0A3S5CPA7_9PLAT|nr:unnamed protein product [Protopolystoma xenopodis]